MDTFCLVHVNNDRRKQKGRIQMFPPLQKIKPKL